MFCAKCGTEIPDEHSFCTKCGSGVPQAPPKAGLQMERTSKVSRSRTILIVLSLLLRTWAGSAGIAYGVVELTGGGPQGEQGEQGSRGATGSPGSSGALGTDFGTVGALQRLAGMWAVGTLREGGDHPQVQACIDYIMDGTGSFVECGFIR